jgi:hypothetical protein
MKKRVCVERLRDISKQRSIRRPLLAEPEIRRVESEGDPLAKVEWPIRN